MAIKHLACIMDGNRRWAKKNVLEAIAGHKKGGQVIETVIDFCLAQSISYLSLFAFSLENFNRPEYELARLFELFEQYGQELLHTNKKNVAIRFVGDRSKFPVSLVPLIERIESTTRGNTQLHLNVLFCYGGRQEMVDAVKQVLVGIQQGHIVLGDLSEELLSRHLWLGNIPEPDLIIRTGGVKRLSNFLLYQAAYAELYFLDCLWPDITTEHLHDAVTFFAAAKRNFGT